MRTVQLVVIAIVLGIIANSRAASAPAPPKEPIVVLGRTAAASYFEPSGDKPLFILVIGSDVRSGDPAAGRSDSLHILALNPRSGAGTIIGIPRDSWIDIPGHGTNKINSALDFGGPELTVQTVEQLSGIPIQYWALIDFSRFTRLVDKLGGINVTVPYEMRDLQYSGADFAPGRHHMNGDQALAFARDRHSLDRGDFDRSVNQGRLLLEGLKKFRSEAGDPIRLFAYLTAFSSLVRSNVPTSELIDLAEVARRMDPAKITNLVLPGAGGSAGGASVVFVDPSAQDLFAKVRDDGIL